MALLQVLPESTMISAGMSLSVARKYLQYEEEAVDSVGGGCKWEARWAMRDVGEWEVVGEGVGRVPVSVAPGSNSFPEQGK